MDEYLSEREQVDRIRQWWKENGAWIIVGVGGGILAIISWNWWQNWKLERAEQASAIYSVLVQAAGEGRVEEVRLGVDRLAAGHGSSPYLQQGRLALAAALVRTGENQAAITQLEAVLADADDPQLKLVARARLARLLAADGNGDQALRLVRGVDAGAFGPVLLEIEGDVLAARDDSQGALEAYRKALAGGSGSGVVDEDLLRLKIEALEGGGMAGDAS